MSGAGPEVPFPLSLKDGMGIGITSRLASGKYSAVEVNGFVTVRADSVRMSGLRPYAELVLIPTFVPPVKFELRAFETLPQVANLIFGSAETHFKAHDGADSSVTIVDADGEHSVDVSHP